MSQKENQAIGDINGSVTGKYEERSHFLFLGALEVEFRTWYIREITLPLAASLAPYFFPFKSRTLVYCLESSETALES